MLDLNESITLPALPGFKSTQPTKHQRGQGFNRAQTLQYKNGYRVDQIGTTLHTAKSLSERNTEIDVEQLLEKTNQLRFGDRIHFLPPKSVMATRVEVPLPDPPTHFDPRSKKAPLDVSDIVFRFEGYVKETVPAGVRIETAGGSDTVIRRMVVSYFPKDETIEVTEPITTNSGLAQGSVLKRDRIPKDGRYGGDHYTIRDFALSKDLVFYGRTYRITACDKFTEKYCANVLNLTLSVPGTAQESIPADAYLEGRQKALQHAAADVARHSDTESHDKLRKFIEDDKKVLRFYCSWNEHISAHSTELSYFEVHYYLLDDTIEVRPVKKANSGLDAFPILIRRQKLPKHMTGLEDLATTTPIGAASHTTAAGKAGRFCTWRDFHIGQYIEMLGRPFLVNDVDGFTREFYLTRGQRTVAEMTPAPVPVVEQQHRKHAGTVNNQHQEKENGAQSDEFLKQQSRRPNIFRMLKNEGKVLRFAAEFDESQNGKVGEYDAARRFIVMYRLADDIMSIYEQANKAAGTASGKFMERGTPMDPITHNYYEPQDLFIGARLTIHGRTFRLTDADEFVMHHMEAHPEQFPKSNASLVLATLSRNSAGVAALGSLRGQTMSQQQLGKIIATEFGVTQHEAITVARAYAANSQVKVDDVLAALA